MQPRQDAQGFVDGPHRAWIEAAGRGSEAPRINGCRLLDEDAGRLAEHVDRGPEARRSRARRGRRDEHRAELEQLVGLQDDGEPRSTLLVTLRPGGRRQAEHLAADHLRPERRSELVHVLPDQPHLLAVVRVSGRRRASSRSAERLPAASLQSIRTASESFRPSARITSRAAALGSGDEALAAYGVPIIW